MALSPNLNLVEIQSSDYVSPKDIDDNFKTIDKLGLDYITDQGVSGNWTYRKWKSGFAECWARHDFAATTASGHLQSGVRFPFSFSSSPVVTMAAGVSGRADAYISYTQSSKDQVDCYIYKGTDGDLARWNYCYAFGKLN